MKLLAIDTTLEACSVGVLTDDGAIVVRSEIVGRGHAERLMPMIADAMAEARVAFAGLDRIAVAVGPGSFTGTRIGVAAARGLALATGAEAVGLGTLAAHAAEARRKIGEAPVLAVLAAGRGDVYGQSFSANGAEDGPAEVGDPESFACRLDVDTMIAGSGVDALLAILGGKGEARVVHRRSAPDIATLIDLGCAATHPGGPPRPLYLRPPDAKPQFGGVARR